MTGTLVHSFIHVNSTDYCVVAERLPSSDQIRARAMAAQIVRFVSCLFTFARRGRASAALRTPLDGHADRGESLGRGRSASEATVSHCAETQIAKRCDGVVCDEVRGVEDGCFSASPGPGLFLFLADLRGPNLTPAVHQ